MNKIYLVLFILFLSCNNENISKKNPPHNFCGYGVIKFSKSYLGSIRYMEFYPIISAKYPDSILASKIKISVYNGMIIRGYNWTKLWQDLTESNYLKSDEGGFYKSLIFLDLSKSTLEYDYTSPIPNRIIIENESFTTKTFDYTTGELNISNYKIFRSL